MVVAQGANCRRLRAGRNARGDCWRPGGTRALRGESICGGTRFRGESQVGIGDAGNHVVSNGVVGLIDAERRVSIQSKEFSEDGRQCRLKGVGAFLVDYYIVGL
jgi:hypothetical protein